MTHIQAIRQANEFVEREAIRLLNIDKEMYYKLIFDCGVIFWDNQACKSYSSLSKKDYWLWWQHEWKRCIKAMVELGVIEPQKIPHYPKVRQRFYEHLLKTQ